MDTLAELLPGAAAAHADRIALTVGDRQLSFAMLDGLAAQVAHALRGHGVGRGDRVSIYGANSVEWVAVYHGALRIGACVNPVNVMLTPDEIGYVLRDCGSSALFADCNKLEPLMQSAALAALKLVVGLNGAPQSGGIAFEAFVQGMPRFCSPTAVDPGELSTICYTSGTTGHPKGAMHSHTNVLLNAKLTALMHGRTSKDIVVSALPCPHVYGNVVMNAGLLAGATLVLHPRFEEQAVLESIARYHATMFEGVPAMYLFLLNHPALAEADLSSLRLCTVGGQTMPVPKMRAVEQRFGCPLIELWGMTELAGLGTTFSHLGPIKHGSIGVPLPSLEAKIVDVVDASRTLGVDEPGELMLRGPVVMQGYFNNEVATHETIEPDGWLHTGDIAKRDADGLIYVLDRKKDVILTGGYNVYPAEIERVLAEHPDVAVAAVGAVPDEIKGELPRAYIVLRAGAPADEHALLAFCRIRLAAYKMPRSVRFVGDLPRTSSGKIMRRRLHELDAASNH